MTRLNSVLEAGDSLCNGRKRGENLSDPLASNFMAVIPAKPAEQLAHFPWAVFKVLTWKNNLFPKAQQSQGATINLLMELVKTFTS